MLKQIVLGCLLLISTVVSATSLNKIVVFGDSLSDNGNLYHYVKEKFPPSPPYFQGRFTNGYVWAEHLAQFYYGADWQSHILDYAFGGAGVLTQQIDPSEMLFSLEQEIDSYLLTHQNRADENSLFVIWIGVNNYLFLTEPDHLDDMVQTVNDGIKSSLKRLAERGAKHILVINLPDVGKSPIARGSEVTEQLSYCMRQNNELLSKNIAELQVANPDVQWLVFDANFLFQTIIEKPADFGFSNITDTCLIAEANQAVSPTSVLNRVPGVKAAAKIKPTCEGYLFFDPVHPTELTHRVMAVQLEHLFQSLNIDFA